MRLLRSPLVHFLLAGLALHALQTAWSRAPEDPVVIVQRSEIEDQIEAYRRQMGRRPTESELRSIENQVIENALWLDQARALGLHEIDSVVRQRLVLNMRFLDAESKASDQELFERAVELGMDRSDTVVRRRLVDRVQAIVRAGVRARPLDEQALQDYFARSAERWREPALLDLTHVYLSSDKRGDATRRDAAALLDRLRAGPVEPEAAIALGDPFLAGHRLRGATPNRIVARLGPSFAEGVAEAEAGRWLGPIESAFGEHLVWIHDRVESRVPELAEVRKRVVEDWIEQQSREALREQAERLRARAEIRIVEDRGEAGAPSAGTTEG